MEKIFEKVVELLKEDKRCKGGWHYGSISRGEEDIFKLIKKIWMLCFMPMWICCLAIMILWTGEPGKARADFKELETAVKRGMLLFREDAREICREKGLDYPETIGDQVIAYFNKRIDSEDWA